MRETVYKLLLFFWVLYMCFFCLFVYFIRIQGFYLYSIYYQDFQDILYIEMAKKINRKPKIVRSSSIDKTIQDGNDYVSRATSLFAKRNRSLAPPRSIKPQPKKISKRTKSQKKKTPKTARTNRKVANSSKRRSSAASRPALIPVAPTLPVAVPVGVARTNSRVSRTGSKNLAKSASKNLIIEQQLQDRLGKHKANIGKLNFSLRWWDPNDLDLHVICPCGTQIYYMNKKCARCGGELDVDMNVGMNMSLQPVEHVYFNNPKPGLYKFFVQYFYGPKQFSGVKGTDKSKYALSLHEDLKQIFRYEDTVSNTHRQMHYDFNL